MNNTLWGSRYGPQRDEKGLKRVRGHNDAKSVTERLLEWYATGERGLSSEAIARTTAGLSMGNGRDSRVPLDAADLRRCVLLLRAVPEAYENGVLVLAAKYRNWRELAAVWPQLERTLTGEMGQDLALSVRTPRHLQDDEGRSCEGHGGERFLMVATKSGKQRRTRRRCLFCDKSIKKEDLWSIQAYPSEHNSRAAGEVVKACTECCGEFFALLRERLGYDVNKPRHKEESEKQLPLV